MAVLLIGYAHRAAAYRAEFVVHSDWLHKPTKVSGFADICGFCANTFPRRCRVPVSLAELMIRYVLLHFKRHFTSVTNRSNFTRRKQQHTRATRFRDI